MKYDCPSCGQPFNGKRCKNCGYESFNEEIAHRLHTHKGEPLVIKDTERRQIPSQDPFGCPPKRERKKFGPTFIIALCALGVFLLLKIPALRRPAFTFSQAVPEPAEEASQEVVLLYYTPSLTVSTPADETLREDTVLYLRSSRKVHVKVRNLTINGYCLDDYCYLDQDLPAKEEVECTLSISFDGLELCQITQLQEMTFQLELLDPDSWKVLETTPAISIPVEADADYVQPDCDEGPLIFDRDGLRIVGRGSTLWFEGEEPSYAEVNLYMENNTDKTLSVYTQNSKMDGENISLRFWTTLPAHSKTVTRATISDRKFPSEAEFHDITTELWYTDSDLNVSNETITIPTGDGT